MTKLEVFPPSINAKFDGKHVKFEKVKKFCKDIISDITVSYLTNGELNPKDEKLRIAVATIQVLLNEKEELKDQLEKIRCKQESS